MNPLSSVKKLFSKLFRESSVGELVTPQPTLCKVKLLRPDATLPTRADVGASGWDLYAAEDLNLYPGEMAMVGTGLAMEVPLGYEIQIRPRSGLAAKYGITVLNTPGTVDSSYRGEVKVLLYRAPISSNAHNKDVFVIKKKDRIAQAVIMQLPTVKLIEVSNLSETSRGEGGFGSSGR